MDQLNQQTQAQAGGQAEQRDVSRQTMVVLVILAIVVSLLGTFTVIKETSTIDRVNLHQEEGSPEAQGYVALTIVNPSDLPAEQNDMATGRVVFTIKDQ